MIVSCFMMVGGLVGLLDVSVGLHVLRAACCMYGGLLALGDFFNDVSDVNDVNDVSDVSDVSIVNHVNNVNNAYFLSHAVILFCLLSLSMSLQPCL